MRHITLLSAGLFLLLGIAVVHAQTNDHLKCYQITDPVKLDGIVDLNSPQFGAENGCKIGKAKFFCVPATKTVISAHDKATHLPVTPLPVTGPNPGDRICYKLKCPEPFPPDTQVTDQFGTRTVTKFKTSMLCTPAFKGSARFVDNGDGTVTDNQTGLQWEQKVAGSGCLHCVDDSKTWDTAMVGDWISEVNGSSADGTTQTGFDSHSDWRIPTSAELQTILLAPYPCGTSPCIDAIFGPTAASDYWSSTNDGAPVSNVWVVSFASGFLDTDSTGQTARVRAVRGGS